MSTRKLLAVAALATIGAACASAPAPDARLESARMELQQLAADSLSASASPEAVADANAALARAEAAWERRDSDALVHEVRMVNGNVRLANAEIGNARAESAIAATVVRRENASLALTQRQVRSAEADAAAARADALMARSETAMARSETANARADLAAYQTRRTELGTLLVFQDLMFEVGSARLRAGAEQRLDPLARYLAQHPDVRVRIDGHTDSTGNAGYNLELSQQRADAVADYFAARGVSRDRFQTHGFGETAPIASNTSRSGREENRRVEITLLDS